MTIRAVTAAECEDLHEHGWVRLDGLVSSEVAAELLGRARQLIAARVSVLPQASGGVVPVMSPSQDDERFGALARGPEIGRVAGRLLGWRGAIRLWADALVPVEPHTELPPGGDRWHQDAGKLPLDMAAVSLWIALNEIEPEQGQLRFRDRSHRLGLLGASGALEGWPALEACPVASPGRMAPGDATAHLSTTVLAAGANRTARAMWPYSLKYFPDGARYTGLPAVVTDPLGLVAGQSIDPPQLPLVFGGHPDRGSNRFVMHAPVTDNAIL